ncbi:DUF6152 family protein [Chelativorans sp. J32]|uniref:DUF6152 family protein n=1 Tax=Chelativorans sp. J32 TaxID=935840 RepID=UPI0004875317|nr:DUF6152 family protein [Chelativorans sp. J32]
MRMPFSPRRLLGPSIALGLAIAHPAFAHHGWSWTADETSELEGTITKIYVGNPHATLDVDVNGESWRVELAPPSQTMRAGFSEDTAKPGAHVTAIGNRSLDQNERRMKAVRIIIDGKTYDVYPNRVPSN